MRAALAGLAVAGVMWAGAGVVWAFECPARIDEARDTPAMSMVQSPENGLTRTRSWPLALLSALVVGLLLANVDFFVRESASARTTHA